VAFVSGEKSEALLIKVGCIYADSIPAIYQNPYVLQSVQKYVSVLYIQFLGLV
jgi:hypothetical protein